ncbi:hypothetical protein C2E23DRAFT_268826 [Lenzites betulinus]|nr:hypothetical protein C2E23DRAFT_268826 [Lenzites betulinus]
MLRGAAPRAAGPCLDATSTPGIGCAPATAPSRRSPPATTSRKGEPERARCRYHLSRHRRHNQPSRVQEHTLDSACRITAPSRVIGRASAPSFRFGRRAAVIQSCTQPRWPSRCEWRPHPCRSSQFRYGRTQQRRALRCECWRSAIGFEANRGSRRGRVLARLEDPKARTLRERANAAPEASAKRGDTANMKVWPWSCQPATPSLAALAFSSVVSCLGGTIGGCAALGRVVRTSTEMARARSRPLRGLA